MQFKLGRATQSQSLLQPGSEGLHRFWNWASRPRIRRGLPGRASELAREEMVNTMTHETVASTGLDSSRDVSWWWRRISHEQSSSRQRSTTELQVSERHNSNAPRPWHWPCKTSPHPRPRLCHERIRRPFDLKFRPVCFSLAAAVRQWHARVGNKHRRIAARIAELTATQAAVEADARTAAARRTCTTKLIDLKSRVTRTGRQERAVTFELSRADPN